jgi:oxalate decarboxylase
MDPISRRHMLAATAAGGLLTSTALAHAQTGGGAIPQPERLGHGGTDPGPRNLMRDQQNPDLLVPPSTDSGTLPNLRFSFSDAHMRLAPGGWTRQVTERELPIAKSLAGVNMRLNAGGVRELHWHKASEWAFVLQGTARVTAIDSDGSYFVDDVNVGDLWFFPGGTPHSIQGLGPDGCEFLLVFDDGGFDEDNTFLINDWFKHVPNEVLGKNFGVPASLFGDTPPESERYIFAAPLPGPLSSDSIPGSKAAETSFTWRLMEQEPTKTESGTVRINDSRLFKVNTTTAAGLVEVNPGGLRELHWHPNADEWLFVIEGQARLGVFGGQGLARTFDLQAGDVGYVPLAMGHYLENTGSGPLRFLETFKADRFIDFSLDTWMANTPPELVQAHLNLDPQVISALRKTKAPVVPD